MDDPCDNEALAIAPRLTCPQGAKIVSSARWFLLRLRGRIRVAILLLVLLPVAVSGLIGVYDACARRLTQQQLRTVPSALLVALADRRLATQGPSSVAHPTM